MIWDWYTRVWSHDNGTHCKWHKNEMCESKNLQISVQGTITKTASQIEAQIFPRNEYALVTVFWVVSILQRTQCSKIHNKDYFGFRHHKQLTSGIGLIHSLSYLFRQTLRHSPVNLSEVTWALSGWGLILSWHPTFSLCKHLFQLLC